VAEVVDPAEAALETKILVVVDPAAEAALVVEATLVVEGPAAMSLNLPAASTLAPPVAVNQALEAATHTVALARVETHNWAFRPGVSHRCSF